MLAERNQIIAPISLVCHFIWPAVMVLNSQLQVYQCTHLLVCLPWMNNRPSSGHIKFLLIKLEASTDVTQTIYEVRNNDKSIVLFEMVIHIPWTTTHHNPAQCLSQHIYGFPWHKCSKWMLWILHQTNSSLLLQVKNFWMSRFSIVTDNTRM